ncbi:MAG: amino acid adenylation domain-containing protein, partial [Bacteroidota bacterium]
VNSFEGSYHEQNLPLELCAPIRNLSKDFGVTLYVFMLAAYKIMLQKYTDTYDIIVGSPISNRDQSSLEQQIGFFNETIALRTQLKETDSFRAIVAQVNQTTVEAFQHKNTPFEQIVKAVNPDRAQVVNPIFQVMFILHHVPKTPEFEGDLQLVHEPFDFGVCKFDLTLYVSDEGEQLRTLFEYAHDVFAVDTIARMQGYYQHILAQIVQNPEIKLADIELITPKEKQQIAYDWNDTALPLADVPHLPALLERMAVQYPDRKAVSDSKHSITYRVLNERANTIAHRLLENGLEANQIVGLLAERSVEMLVGIWGILKAGGAYLPIDPDYPKARTKFLLEDANLSIILTQAALKDSLPDDIQKLIVLDEADNKVGSAKQVAVNIQKDQLAYMIYTSGSTGKPKGVAISHANLIHSTLARQHYYPQSPTAFLLLSSFAFDSSVAGIFWTLCTGGHLVLPPKRIEQDVEALGDLIAKHQVTHTLLLPSLYNAVLNYIATAQLASLQTVVVAGEACTRALSHLHYQQLPNAKLYNEYGPTEASVWCTVHELQPEVTDRSVPIGRPIPNAKAYILNPQMQAMPVGVVGELYIGGLGIAQGYWQRAALTTERFLPNPFGTSATEKIYKTGDLARYRSDGTIDFLGRKDRQVKVRGYRIELEEVRHAIEQQSEVEAAVVIIHQPETGENTQKNASLVAFVQAANDLNVSDLRDHLKDHLPNYMIPANFQLVDVFPKLPNGKIDVNALTEAYQATDNQTDQYEKPTSELEQALVDIWESVLKQQPIGVNDNFFEIGGDSILSIQIVARARKAGIVLASNAIFEHQSIAKLSLFAQFKTAEKTNNELLRGESPLLPIQQWFFETHQNAPAHWNQAFRFDLPQQLAVEKVEATARLLIQQHDALRLRFVQENHQWTSYFNELEKAAIFQLYDGTSLDIFGQEKQLAHELRALQQEFDLSQGNLFKVCYFKNGASQRDQLVFLAHHLVVDAISWQVIVEDFSNIYEQLDKEQTVQLGSKTESYQAWGNTLKTWAANGKFQAELDYWQQQKSLALPTDMEATAPITEATTRTLTLELDEAHTTQLLSDIHEAYNTKVEEILIAALVLSLQQKYELSSVTFGLERHGREALDETFDFSESVGWFTTQFPLTITTSLAMDLGDLIKTVKEQIRAVPNKGLGYGVLRYLSKSTELNQALPLNFNYLGQVAAVEDQLLGKA